MSGHHEHEHGHGHHHHHHHTAEIKSLGTIYIFSIVLNVLFVCIEAGMGAWTGSLSLLSDAGHNLGDVFSLALAMIAFKLATTRSSKRFTYGYRKTSVLISLLNAIILLVAVGAIIIESVHKLASRGAIDLNGAAISWTAGVGIVVNGLTAWLLSREQKHDVNTRGAYLHMVADTLVSVGVVLSGIVITLTGWTIVDPLLSLTIAAVILISTWSLLSESFRMSIDAVPAEIDPDEIVEELCEPEGVKGAHHVHIWPISTTEVALTAHVVIDDIQKMHEMKHEIKHELAEHGITHCTLEFETEDSVCEEHDCSCK